MVTLTALTVGSATLPADAVAPSDAGHPAPARGAAPAASRQASLDGSLVFVKDYNVWSARPDGSSARPLTTDGSFANPWHSPTQADTGDIAGQGPALNLVFGAAHLATGRAPSRSATWARRRLG